MTDGDIRHIHGGEGAHRRTGQTDSRRGNLLVAIMIALIAVGSIGLFAAILWLPDLLRQWFVDECLRGGQLRDCGGADWMLETQFWLVIVAYMSIIIALCLTCAVKLIWHGVDTRNTFDVLETGTGVRAYHVIRWIALAAAFLSLVAFMVMTTTAWMLLS